MKFKIGDCVVVDIKPSDGLREFLYYVQWERSTSFQLGSSSSTGAYYDFQLALYKEKIRENKLKELLEC